MADATETFSQVTETFSGRAIRDFSRERKIRQMPRGYTGVTVKETSETVKRGKRGRFGKGTKPGPGRPKGLLNKFTGDLKEAFLQAAQAAGGSDGIAGYLYDQAIRDNPSPFMTGLAKLLPLILEGNKDAPIIVERVRHTDGGSDGDAK
jgi:hypothetical protein